MAYKVYQTTSILELHTCFIVEGRRVDVAFIGGTRSPVRKGGTFGTHNAKLQFVMERHSGFNTKYKLVYDGTVVIPEPEVVVTKEEIDPDTNPVLTVNTTGSLVTGITSGQKARTWLLENVENVTVSMLKNNVQVRAVAFKNNIVFPDWPEL
jgi:transcriptional regulator of nitric oxide reductase